MTALIREWRREAERKPFDAAAWNRLANVNNGNLAAFTTWVDADGDPLVETDPTTGASSTTLAGIATFGASTGVDIAADVAITGAVGIIGNTTVAGTFGVTGASTFTGAVTINTGPVAITAAVGITGDTTLTGNLLFAGASRRITGDFSNATLASRTLFQTSTVNANSFVAALPNGTATQAGWYAYNNATPSSASVEAVFRAVATGVQIRADSPTGSYQAISFVTNNAIQGSIDGSGYWNIASGGGQRIGVFAKTPAAQQSISAAATDPATTMALVNEIRTILRTYGWAS